MSARRTFIAMLRGVNVGGHRKIRMEALRSVCESIGLRSVQTHVQSGNVVFSTTDRNTETLATRIEAALANAFGFRPDVILRTLPELQEAIARSPFAAREGIEPSKLLVLFLARDPGDEVRGRVAQLPAGPEELHVSGRELYIYFPNGMGRPKLSMAAVERTLKVPGTGRNWNTVTKLAELASRLV